MKAQELWQHFEPRIVGLCVLYDGEKEVDARFQTGLVESGKTRVYEGLYVRVRYGEQPSWLGRDRWCFQEALLEVAIQARQKGFELRCAGISPNWYETGLSSGSGYGYLKGREHEGAFHICDPLTLRKEGALRSGRSDNR
jgi:hypothetical protein